MNNTQPKDTAQDRGSKLTLLWVTVFDELKARRAAQATRKQLERELAVFTSDAELADLQATLDRYADAEAAPVREILSRQQWKSVA